MAKGPAYFDNPAMNQTGTVASMPDASLAGESLQRMANYMAANGPTEKDVRPYKTISQEEAKRLRIQEAIEEEKMANQANVEMVGGQEVPPVVHLAMEKRLDQLTSDVQVLAQSVGQLATFVAAQTPSPPTQGNEVQAPTQSPSPPSEEGGLRVEVQGSPSEEVKAAPGVEVVEDHDDPLEAWLHQVTPEVMIWLTEKRPDKFFKSLMGQHAKQVSYDRWPPYLQETWEVSFQKIVTHPSLVNRVLRHIWTFQDGRSVVPKQAAALIALIAAGGALAGIPAESEDQ